MVLQAKPLNPSAGGMAMAVVQDCLPMSNIPPFGMCSSPSNPAVQEEQGAPAPCIPVTTPWSPGAPMVKFQGVQAVTASDTCKCQWQGVISVTTCAQSAVTTA